jgi:hypothetical protein
LYFTSEAPNGVGKDDIFFCKWEDKYSPPILLDTNINSSGEEFNAFISRNEDFLLFTKYNSEGGLGSGDLYLAKKEKGGAWSKAQNLGVNINTKFMEYCPFYDEKNEILYFTSRRNSIQPRKFKNVADLQETILRSESGLSKIYKVEFKIK